MWYDHYEPTDVRIVANEPHPSETSIAGLLDSSGEIMATGNNDGHDWAVTSDYVTVIDMDGNGLWDYAFNREGTWDWESSIWTSYEDPEVQAIALGDPDYPWGNSGPPNAGEDPPGGS